MLVLMLLLMLIDDCVAATRSTANVKSSGWLVSVIGVARGGKFAAVARGTVCRAWPVWCRDR